MSKRSRDRDYYIQALSQQLSHKIPYISDYACNVFADKIAQLDFVIEEIEDSEVKRVLEKAREILLRQGTALWFMQAGELSNLGARLGTTTKEASLKGRKERAH